jgi:hypothetical protein
VVENPAARFGKLRVNEATKALARLWLHTGQVSLQRRRREVSDHLRVEVETFLGMLKPEDDWYGRELGVGKSSCDRATVFGALVGL